MFEDTVLTQHVLSIAWSTFKTKQCKGKKSNKQIPSKMNTFVSSKKKKKGCISPPMKSLFSVHAYRPTQILLVVLKVDKGLSLSFHLPTTLPTLLFRKM